MERRRCFFSKPFTKHLPHQTENLAPTADEASEYLCLLVQRPEALMTLGSLSTALIWIISSCFLLKTNIWVECVCILFWKAVYSFPYHLSRPLWLPQTCICKYTTYMVLALVRDLKSLNPCPTPHTHTHTHTHTHDQLCKLSRSSFL